MHDDDEKALGAEGLTIEAKRAIWALSQPIDRSVIESKAGRDYVRAGWVFARMNEILGPAGWSSTVLSSGIVAETEVPARDGGTNACIIARAHVRLTVHLLGGVTREDVACGSGVGSPKNLPDLYHAAVGEAVTDAMKRCAARLGHQLGGGLYLHQADPRREHGSQEWRTERDRRRAQARRDEGDGQGSEAASKAFIQRQREVARIVGLLEGASSVAAARRASQDAVEAGVRDDERVDDAIRAARARLMKGGRRGDDR